MQSNTVHYEVHSRLNCKLPTRLYNAQSLKFTSMYSLIFRSQVQYSNREWLSNLRPKLVFPHWIILGGYLAAPFTIQDTCSSRWVIVENWSMRTIFTLIFVFHCSIPVHALQEILFIWIAQYFFVHFLLVQFIIHLQIFLSIFDLVQNNNNKNEMRNTFWYWKIHYSSLLTVARHFWKYSSL